MGFFDKLIGREPDDAGWESASSEKRAARTRAVLEQAASLASMANAAVYTEKHDGNFELRGELHGLPCRVKMDDRGESREVDVKYARMTGEYIDIEFDPELPAHGSNAAPPWSPDDQKVFLAPQIFLEGSSANKGEAAWQQLPASLRERVVAVIRSAKILYFRSRYDELEVTLRSDTIDRANPARWLADILSIAADVSAARGARPPGVAAPTPPPDDDDADARQAIAVARSVAASIPGAAVVERVDDECIDVRWTEHGYETRMVFDHGFDDLDLAVAVPHTTGAFEIFHETDAEPDTFGPSEGTWDLRERRAILASHAYLCGTPIALARQVAVIEALDDALVREVVAAMTSNGISSITLGDSILSTTFGDLAGSDSAAAVRVAKLLARVAAALRSI